MDWWGSAFAVEVPTLMVYVNGTKEVEQEVTRQETINEATRLEKEKEVRT